MLQISGLGSYVNDTHVSGADRFEKSETKINSTQSGQSNNEGYFVEISDEAKQAFDASQLKEYFTPNSYELLKKRNISDKDMNIYKDIIEESKKAPNAKIFLKGLSAEKLDLVKRVNSYGHKLCPSHIDGMSEEGARNMLNPPGSGTSVDDNNDGFVDLGQAKMFVFPPPNAPEDVKEAWDKSTASLSDVDRLIMESLFMNKSLRQNLKQDANGRDIDYFNVEDDEYVNIFPTEKNGWSTLLEEIDETLDYAGRMMPVDKKREIIHTFRDHLFQ